MDTRKVVINTCFGGFGLSDAAYEKLIEWGVPARRYMREDRGDTGRVIRNGDNEGEIIFDRSLTPRGEDRMTDMGYWSGVDSGNPVRAFGNRYWASWTRNAREHPLIVRVVEELGTAANGDCAQLKVVEIPADISYEISEYDGNEHIAETHRTWP